MRYNGIRTTRDTILRDAACCVVMLRATLCDNTAGHNAAECNPSDQARTVEDSLPHDKMRYDTTG